MNKCKKGLAILLALAMCVSLLPSTALAVKDASAYKQVTYNLKNNPVTVGSDGQTCDVVFAEDGSYTIPLEDDAFFPYEIQFTCEGETWEEWFMTPDDSKEVGGHTFYVQSFQSDPTALNQIGVWVGDTYVPAFPEKKSFSDGMILFTNLMPLKTVYFNLDLSGFLPGELKEVKVSAILNGLEKRFGDDPPAIDPNDLVVWAVNGEDNYRISAQGDTIDLSDLERWDDLELIVGTDDQLDLDNIRYHVDLTMSDRDKIFDAVVATESDRESIDVIDIYSYDWNTNGEEYSILYARVDKKDIPNGEKFYLGLSLSDEYIDRGYSATVYEGYYETEEAAVADEAKNITSDIWNQDNITNRGGYLKDYSYNSDVNKRPAVTVVFSREGKVVQTVPVILYLYPYSISVYAGGLYTVDESCTWVYNRSSYEWDSTLKGSIETITLKPGYSIASEYRIEFNSHNTKTGESGVDNIQKAVVGNYDSLEAASEQIDIKNTLFSDPYESTDNGYRAVFSGDGVTFTIFDIDGDVHKFRVNVVEGQEQEELPDAPMPNSADTYFRIQGADSQTGEIYFSSYEMPYDADSYYYNGYQTVFLLKNNESPVDELTIIPTFYTGNKVKMFASQDETSAVEQISGTTPVNFTSGVPIAYSASAENGTNLKNYWVTFLTQQNGPKLFVNATNDPSRYDEELEIPIREVFLTDEYDNHHDVFIANIGNQDIENLYVKLIDAENIALDEYWTIKDTGTRKLSAFTSTSESKMKNMAKIRLISQKDESGNEKTGVISGTLVIGYGDPNAPTEEVKIKLTGVAGSVKITTDSVVDGVKYVPYSCVIQTNNMYASDAVSFELVKGKLPTGVILKENGELYGVPKEVGEFTFTVQATYDGQEGTDSKEFTLKVLDNTDENVENSTDEGYELTERITATKDSSGNYKDEVFRSSGEYGQFVDVYLDGEKLTEGEDYDSESGSTKITVKSKTFKNLNNGSHTIAAEFRTGGKSKTDSTMKKSAQNFKISGNNSGSGSKSGGGSSGSKSGGSSGSNSTVSPVQPQPSINSQPQNQSEMYSDVLKTDWFYPEVVWAYENKIMVGVGNKKFDPKGLISYAQVVTVLSRIAKADLTAYIENPYADISSGQWYTSSALWAREKDLLPDGEFSAEPPVLRGDFAIMLVEFLKLMNVDCSMPQEKTVFSDADKMTQAENDAFQILYKLGIFKGIGGNAMDPGGSTTRAQLSTLLHRIADIINYTAQ